MPALEINNDRIRNAGDHVMPDSFPQYDQDGVPISDVLHLAVTEPGTRVVDAKGQRFLVMAHGPMQSTVVMRDRYRAMFYADVDHWFKVASR